MDPVAADGNIGVNFNRYWYANNNPFKFVDPDGRYVCKGSKEGCAQIETAIQDTRAAAANLPEGSEERQRLTAVGDMFGSAGEDNGVKIRIRDASRLGGARTSGRKTTITISIKAIENQVSQGGPLQNLRFEIAGIVAHEGDHALTQRGNGMPKNRADAEEGERSAYRSQAQTHRGLGYRTSNYGLWLPGAGINESQVEKMTQTSVDDWCAQGGACR